MWELLGFVKRGRLRKAVMSELLAEPQTPSDLSRLLKKQQPSVSACLIDLAKAGLVECMNPKAKMGRIYGLTKKGKSVMKLTQKK